jgi:hypothetical protein
MKYKLIRVNDNKIIEANLIKFIEWDREGRFSNLYDEPGIGRSVILDPKLRNYKWMTTEIISFNYDGDNLLFSTKNSNYVLEIVK